MISENKNSICDDNTNNSYNNNSIVSVVIAV